MVETGKLATAALIALACAFAWPATAPAGEPDSGHTHGVNARGDRAMGFSHMKTTHHFRLLPDGGAIEVTVNDLADSVSRNAIRAHMTHIARMFAAGDFSAPMLIHDRVPPGVPDLQRLRGKIRYAYEPSANGGRVIISTRNAGGLVAIHEFLRFQITDHKTGDPLEVVDTPR
jgi:hypothetical protein